MRKKEEVKTLSMIMTLSGTSYYYGEHTQRLRPLHESGKHPQIFIVHKTDFIRLL